MRVHLSFDTEVWCNGWQNLDAAFPASLERYTRGRSKFGDYALPKTLEILNRHALTGVFFVEPLFSARFGSIYLRMITDPIAAAGQDIQLHLHPERTDEVRPPLIENVTKKRQHLTFYTEDEQTALIGRARQLLEEAIGCRVSAFRAGSFAVNRDTYKALRRNELTVDSSLNAVHDHSEGSLGDICRHAPCHFIEGVAVYPVTVFQDGLGRLRPAQIGACGFDELVHAMWQAFRQGTRDFVIVSHNFEMLKPGTTQPDWVVVRRFEKLCAFLAAYRDSFDVGPYARAADQAVAQNVPRSVVPILPTVARIAAQIRRRVG